MQKSLCVYCASSDRVDPKYFSVAAALGAAMAQREWGVDLRWGQDGVDGHGRAVGQSRRGAGGRRDS